MRCFFLEYVPIGIQIHSIKKQYKYRIIKMNPLYLQLEN